MFNRSHASWRDFYRTAPVLFSVAVFLAADLILCLAGLHFDHTVITGAPAWAKPAKFALSTGIYALSLILILRWTTLWPRTTRVMEAVIGVTTVIEILLIDLQAFRHTTSHFNVVTPFDTRVYAIMGVSIATLWLASIVLLFIVFRSTYRVASLTLAIRAGLLLTVLGAGTGAFMTRMTLQQQAAVKALHPLTIAGAHTVGGRDGGPGIPLLGWNLGHGDLRVAHFIGMHGLQVLVAISLALMFLKVDQRRAIRVVFTVCLSYAALFLFTLLEALRGLPITEHSPRVELFWLAWAGLSLMALPLAVRSAPATYTVLNQRSYEA